MSQRILILVTILVLFAIQALSSTHAHEIPVPPVGNYIMIEDENFSSQYMSTGETLTINGTLVNTTDKDLRVWTSIFSDSSSSSNRWEILARGPQDAVFDVPANGIVEYSISARALEPGTYHIHILVNVANIGPMYGAGQTIIVKGDPIAESIPYANIAYQLIPLGIIITIVILMVHYWGKRKLK